MGKKLIGFRKFISKKGQEFCVATLLCDLSERDCENGYVGQKTEELFLPDSMKDLLNPKDIGKAARVDYEINGGRAYVCGFKVE